MHNDLLSGLALVIVLSISAQWISWRLRLPSILMLLVFGIVAGPVTGLLDTDHLLGDLLFPFVSLSVAIILFEGGLSLRFDDLSEIGFVVRNLITIGVVITWGITAVAGRFILDLDWSIAILLGAILSVTGPTVVIPLLNQIRPTARINSILRWEGIAIDPVGAVLAVLVFEQLLLGDVQIGVALLGLIEEILIGFGLGYFAARVIMETFSRYLVPDTLQNPMVLMIVIGFFTLSNLLQAESGLITVTVMGVVLANQKRFDIVHIVEFKENLQVLLISTLFILLGARLDFSQLEAVGVNVFAFIAVLMLVARPITVFVSTYGSGLTTREKLFVSWMAPRGIVAAAVASIFSLELIDHGQSEAAVLVPLTFSVIIVTVAVYGLTAGSLAARFGIVQKNPQGVLILGAHSWGRKIAKVIQDRGLRVIMVDSNASYVEKASSMGLDVHHGNVLHETIYDELNLSGIGYFSALTPNNEVNALACMHFKDTFGFQEVYQLPRQDADGQNENFPKRLRGKTLFTQDITYEYLNFRFSTGALLREILVEDIDKVEQQLEVVVPLFVVTNEDEKRLLFWTVNNPPQLQVGYTLIGLLDPAEEEILDE